MIVVFGVVCVRFGFGFSCIVFRVLLFLCLVSGCWACCVWCLGLCMFGFLFVLVLCVGSGVLGITCVVLGFLFVLVLGLWCWFFFVLWWLVLCAGLLFFSFCIDGVRVFECLFGVLGFVFFWFAFFVFLLVLFFWFLVSGRLTFVILFLCVFCFGCLLFCFGCLRFGCAVSGVGLFLLLGGWVSCVVYMLFVFLLGLLLGVFCFLWCWVFGVLGLSWFVFGFLFLVLCLRAFCFWFRVLGVVWCVFVLCVFGVWVDGVECFGFFFCFLCLVLGLSVSRLCFLLFFFRGFCVWFFGFRYGVFVFFDVMLLVSALGCWFLMMLAAQVLIGYSFRRSPVLRGCRCGLCVRVCSDPGLPACVTCVASCAALVS